jgi:sugar phosphate permease
VAALGFLQVHALAPYAIIWALSGIVQSLSGPSLVTIAGSWLNNLPHRGFILCLWSGNQNIGNMNAGIISGICLKGFKYEIAWQGSMLVCGW